MNFTKRTLLYVIATVFVAILVSACSGTSSGGNETPVALAIRTGVTDNVLEINWDLASADTSAIEHFRVDIVYEDDITDSFIVPVTETRKDVPFSSEQSGKQYTVSVVVVGKDGKENAFKPPAALNPPVITTQAKPPIVSLDDLQTQKPGDKSTVTVSWTVSELGKDHGGAATEIDSYTVYWKAGKTVNTRQYDGKKENIFANSYTVEGLDSGVEYAFLLEAENRARLKATISAKSIITAVKNVIPPDEIVLSSGSLTTISKKEVVSIQLQFPVPNPGRDAEGGIASISQYTVYWKEGENAFSLGEEEDSLKVEAKTVTTAGEVTIEIEGLKTETIYSLIVEAKNSAHYTSISKHTSIKTNPASPAPPSPIQGLQVSPTTDEVGISVTWDIPDLGSLGTNEDGQAAGFKHYIVYWATDAASLNPDAAESSKRISNHNTHTATLTSTEHGLKGGATYTVAIIVENDTASANTRSRANTKELTTRDATTSPGDFVLAKENVAVYGETIILSFDSPFAGTNAEGQPYNIREYTVYWKKGIIAGQNFTKGDATGSSTHDAAGVTTAGKAAITLESLEQDTSYGIMLEASTASDVSILSNVISAQTKQALGANPPAAVKGLEVNSASDSIKISVSWDVASDMGTNSNGEAANFKRYIVYWSEAAEELDSSNKDRRIIISDVETNTVLIPTGSLQGGSQYTVAIVVENDEEGSNFQSLARSAIVQTPDFSTAPAKLQIQPDPVVDGVNVTIAWTAVADTKEALGTDKSGNKAEFLQYIVYWASISDGKPADVNDPSKRVTVTDITSSSVVIAAKDGLQGNMQYVMYLIVENGNGNNNARSAASNPKIVITETSSVAPGGVTNIAKDNTYTELDALKVEWEAGALGKDGDIEVATNYDIYVATHGQYSAPQTIVASVGSGVQKYSTTETSYVITGLSAGKLYDIVVVAVNSSDTSKQTMSAVQTLRSNGVESIQIHDHDTDVSETTMAKNIGVPLTLQAVISAENTDDTIIWESSDASVINIGNSEKNKKTITLTPSTGGRVTLTLRSQIDADTYTRLTIEVPYTASDAKIVVEDYLAAANIRHNYILFKINLESGAGSLSDFKLTLKNSSQDPPLYSEMTGKGIRERNLSSTAKYILLFSVLGEDPDFSGKKPLVRSSESKVEGSLPGLLDPATQYRLYGAKKDDTKVYNLGSYSTDAFSISDFYSNDPPAFLDTAIHKTALHRNLENAKSERKFTVRSTEPILIPSSIKVKGDSALTHAFNKLNKVRDAGLYGGVWHIPTDQLVSMLWSKGTYTFTQGPGDKMALAEFTTLGGITSPADDASINARVVTAAYDNYGEPTKKVYKRSTQLYLGLGQGQLKTSAGDITVRRVTTWGSSDNEDSEFSFSLNGDFSAITFDFEK